MLYHPPPPSSLHPATSQREERKKRALEAIEAIDLIMVDTDPPNGGHSFVLPLYIGTYDLNPYF